MAKIRKKKYLDTDVLTESLNRIRYLYDSFDEVVVSFSGGKDSTAVLNLCLHVARERGRLPLRAIFVDEEAIHPTTIEYIERVRALPDVALEWYCLPVKHRNACSEESPYWYCWNEEERDLWIRPLPAGAITEHPDFRPGDSFQEWMPKIFPNSLGRVALLTGIRTQESIRRLRVALSKKNDNFINSKADHKNTFRAIPIYDWSSEDVWKLVREWDLDYNRTYDIFNQTKHYNKLLTQRVCPPFGEEPLRGLWIYAECFPEMWHKMLYRVPGVATAWRYANTELYGIHMDKPEDMTWKEYCTHAIEQEEDLTIRNHIRKSINGLIKNHQSKTDDPIHDVDEHVLTGCSWRWFAQIAVKKDLKNRTRAMVMDKAVKKQQKLGITPQEAKRLFGKK